MPVRVKSTKTSQSDKKFSEVDSMRKKFLSVLLVSAMSASLLAGCGDKKDDGKNGKSGSSDIDPTKAPSTDGWDDSKKIYAYSWDDDFSNKLNYVLDKYPEYKDYVEFVTLGVGGTTDEYKTGIDEALKSDKYPSLIPADNDVAKYWSEDDDKTLNLYDIGFTDDLLKNSYDFAKQYGKYGDELKCVTWQGCPGSVFYRRDIAKEVFGSDDPETVQNELKDWDSFFAAADKLKEAGYKIVSSPTDVKYAIWDTQSQPWVDVADDGTETLTLDGAVSEYLETGKKLFDGDYTNGGGMWEEQWAADMSDDAKVFCYFCCPWMVGVMTGNGATEGNWGAVVGPTSYHWGGTYVSVGKDTPNPELCAFLLYELTCDPEIAVAITNGTGDFCNNKEANEKLAGGDLSDDNAAKVFLGGQDPIATWAAAAEGISQANVTYADSAIKAYIDEAAKAYNDGTYSSVDDAVAFVEDKANTELGISK